MWLEAIVGHAEWELAAVVDVDRAGAVRALAGHPSAGVAVATDLALALRDVAADAVVVATPPPDHASTCRHALQAGRAVLVEKPFTTSLVEAVALVEEAGQRALPLLVAQNYRFMRWASTARRLVESGRLGRIRTMSMRYDRPWEDLPPSIAAEEDSVLWEMGPHHLDLVRHLLADEVASVDAVLETFHPGRPAGATLHALVRTENGVAMSYAASYESTGTRWPEGGRRYTSRIVGEAATLHVVQRWLVLEPDHGMPRPVRRGPRRTTEEAALLSELAGAVDGRPSRCSGLDNLRTMACLEACIVSSREDRRVDPRELLADACR